MVAVTGASGHLGANLVRQLLARGDRVRAVIHGETRAVDGLDVQTLRGDILEPESLARAFDGCETVYHLAALISITGSQYGRVERINIDGAANAAKAARLAGVLRYVHVSSVHAYTHAPDQVVDETSARAQGAAPAYDRSKAAGEVAVQREVERGLHAVIVNPSGVIGPYDFGPSRMGQSVLGLATGKIPAVVEGGFDWVDVRDVCASIIAASERGRVGQGYLLGGRWASIAEVGALAAAAANRAPPRWVTPRWLASATAPFAQWAQTALGQEPLFTPEGLYCLLHGSRQVDCSKAQRELGHQSRPLADTIRDTIDWFRTHGRLA